MKKNILSRFDLMDKFKGFSWLHTTKHKLGHDIQFEAIALDDIEQVFDEFMSKDSCFEIINNDSNKIWYDAQKDLPKQTKCSYSDVDVLICRMYKYEIGRTFNGQWINMKNEPLNDVILWSYLPKIPKKMESLFYK